MKRDWKPGDVAIAKYHGEEPRVFVYSKVFGTDQHRWQSQSGSHSARFALAEWWRPLVALDLSPHEVMRALEALRESRGMIAMQVADKLEEAAKVIEPPKPDEPTGLGAVVEDAGGTHWVRIAERGVWANISTVRRYYKDIAAVRVLSAGVTQ